VQESEDIIFIDLTGSDEETISMHSTEVIDLVSPERGDIDDDGY
jgi:hypothetical protein